MPALKIAIVGSAPSSVAMAPFGDPSWQIFGCSPGVYAHAGRTTAWIELHRWEPGVVGKPGTQKPWFTPEYIQWMAMQPLVWMHSPVPEIPNSRALPVDQLTDRWGTNWFTSSVAYMLAMSIDDILEARVQREAGQLPCLLEGEVDIIALYGIDMAACTSGDAKILTSDLRWVRAEELKVGDKLMAFDEEAEQQSVNGVAQRRWRVAEVLEASRLTKPCYKLTLEDGRELICSEDHKWLTHAENECRWKMAKDLVTPQHREDRPSKIVKLTDVWAEDKSWEAGYLAAAFDGEGHISQKLRDGDNGVLRVGFAQRDNAMSDTVVAAMRDRGFDLTVDSAHDGMNGDCMKYTLKGGRVENMRFLGSIRPRRLLEKFKPEDVGMLHKIGKVAVVKAEFIGDYPVIGLRTSTKTFICEGLASHNTEEYGYQRAGCQHFIEIADLMGITVVLPAESDLLRPMPLYGICESSHWHIKGTARMRELTNRKNGAEQMIANATRERDFLAGAIDDLKYNMDTWGEDRVLRPAVVDVFASSPALKAALLAKIYPAGASARSPQRMGDVIQLHPNGDGTMHAGGQVPLVADFDAAAKKIDVLPEPLRSELKAKPLRVKAKKK